jgi:hypothetical protein
MQSVGLLDTIVTVGDGKTVTVIDTMFVQVACEPKTLYVVVIVGFAVVLGVFVDVKAILGDQVYEVAPVAFNNIELPIHITGRTGVTEIVGFATTVTVEFCA